VESGGTLGTLILLRWVTHDAAIQGLNPVEAKSRVSIRDVRTKSVNSKNVPMRSRLSISVMHSSRRPMSTSLPTVSHMRITHDKAPSRTTGHMTNCCMVEEKWYKCSLIASPNPILSLILVLYVHVQILVRIFCKCFFIS
jgi:hypothetical protein